MAMEDVLTPIGEAAGARSAGLNPSLLDASADCIKVTSVEGELEFMNANGLCLMEIEDFSALRGRHWAEFWPAEHRAKIYSAVAQAGAGGVARFSADCPTAKGTPKTWDVVVSPVFDHTGRITRIIAISRDDTDRRRIEEQNGLLTRELAHRIKNIFAIVDGVIHLSARAAPEAKPFAATLRSRLLSIGRAIAYGAPPQMEAESSEQHTLQGLLRAVLAPYAEAGEETSRLEICGDDTPVGPTAVTSVALVANELATNALKYGALKQPEGHVRLEIARRDDRFVLTWREEGVGVPEARELGDGEGFGTTMIDNAVARQLGGAITRAWGPEGLIVEVSLRPELLAR
jgi:two-component sensor histidine kinase